MTLEECKDLLKKRIESLEYCDRVGSMTAFQQGALLAFTVALEDINNVTE